MIHIVVADDHVIVRQGFRQLLIQQPDFAVVGEAGDGAGAIRLVDELRPEILVLDLVMPGLSGLEVLACVLDSAPQTRVVILSMYDDSGYVLKALRGGAMAYVLKDSSVQELVQAIRAAMSGRHYLSAPLVDLVIVAYLQGDSRGTTNPADSLSVREREVLRRIGDGQSTGEIAAACALNKRTVETYRTRLLRKLNLHTQAELRRYAQGHSAAN